MLQVFQRKVPYPWREALVIEKRYKLTAPSRTSQYSGVWKELYLQSLLWFILYLTEAVRGFWSVSKSLKKVYKLIFTFLFLIYWRTKLFIFKNPLSDIYIQSALCTHRFPCLQIQPIPDRKHLGKNCVCTELGTVFSWSLFLKR